MLWWLKRVRSSCCWRIREAAIGRSTGAWRDLKAAPKRSISAMPGLLLARRCETCRRLRCFAWRTVSRQRGTARRGPRTLCVCVGARAMGASCVLGEGVNGRTGKSGEKECGRRSLPFDSSPAPRETPSRDAWRKNKNATCAQCRGHPSLLLAHAVTSRLVDQMFWSKRQRERGREMQRERAAATWKKKGACRLFSLQGRWRDPKTSQIRSQMFQNGSTSTGLEPAPLPGRDG
jgi:hypothetical protein